MTVFRINFGNLSIGARLALGFGAVLALLLALAGTAQYKLAQIERMRAELAG